MSAIPYTVERRPDTGVNNVKLGMWLFLASEAMLFAGLFSAYFMLRAGAAEPWQPLRDHLGAAARNTVVLMASTGAFGAAVAAARARTVMPVWGGMLAFRLWLNSSALFALAFCVVKAGEYAALFAQGLGPATNTQLSVYFLLTGVHLLHVAGGIVVCLWLALTRPATWAAAPPVVINRLEAAMLYWYFVDLVWLMLVVLLYVV
jgi:heme/copper-type cytochrome/quinol oxidase subunit 3